MDRDEINALAKWVLLGNDAAPDLPDYHPLRELLERIKQGITIAIRRTKEQK